jgi:hypothetical protein
MTTSLRGRRLPCTGHPQIVPPWTRPAAPPPKYRPATRPAWALPTHARISSAFITGETVILAPNPRKNGSAAAGTTYSQAMTVQWVKVFQ